MRQMTESFDQYPDEGAMAYIAAELGTAFRDKMIATMGGTEIKVPAYKHTLTFDHHLVRHLGQVDAEELVEVAGGQSISIPRLLPGDCPLSNRAAVAALVMAGKNNAEIARELGITTRHVRRMRAQSNLNGNKLAARLGVACHQLADAIRSTPHPLLAEQ